MKPEQDPSLTIPPDQLEALVDKYGVNAELVEAIYSMLAPTHTNAVAATAIALAGACETGNSPMQVALSMTKPNENTE
ncbi:MAG: hypothetical protein JNM91_02735 [Flavobacteriales bacterium]|nr:hypothetical protein [Flavobacteriales bacterium]